MTDHLLVARFKKGGFSRTGTIQEVLQSLTDLLPVDNLYFLVPHPDGQGYSLREAGVAVIDIQPAPALESKPEPEAVEALSQPPLPSSRPLQSSTMEYQFMNDIAPDPKSQAELSTPPEKRKFSDIVKGLIKKVAGPPSGTHFFPNGSGMVTTGFIEATPEQAEAASHFTDNS